MSRPDRDKHIKINWANINPNYRNQFTMTPTGVAFAHGKSYDINSLMHYGAKESAINRQQDTMTSIANPGATLGPEDAGSSFSEGDKRMLKLKGFCDVGV